MAATILGKCSLCLATVKQVRLLHPGARRFYQTTHDDSVQIADVVISGGGMVGAAMACALGHENLLKNKRIVMLEAGPKKQFKLTEKYSNRTCTLSPATTKLFEKVGAWDEIKGMRCHEVLRMQVWESCSNSLITFNQEDMTNNLAYVAENDVILEALTRTLDTIPDRVTVMYDTRTDTIDIPGVDKTAESNTWVTLKLNNGQILKTKLLIGSDGMSSSVRKAAKFHTMSFGYDQSAVVATLHVGECTNTVAWQRFLPTGPIAMLPLSDSVCNMIWTTSKEHAKQLTKLEPESFVDAVNDAFWHDRHINSTAESAINKIQDVLLNINPAGTSTRQLPPTVMDVEKGSIQSFPLGLTHSSNYVRQRVALIGDAAHRMHPLAGQGVNLGFGDVSKLSDVIVKAVSDGSDLGSLAYLKEYETSRQRKAAPTMLTIDGLNRLYGNAFTPLVLARSIGLQAVNAMPGLKEFIVQQASK